MSRAWKDPDDVQQDILEQQQEINALVRAISIKLDEQQRTNQLLEQILNKLDHFATIGKMIVSGLDKGDPKGDESVIIAKKNGKEEKPAEEKKPLVILFDEDGPKQVCPKCNQLAVFDKIEKKYYCAHCKAHLDWYCGFLVPLSHKEIKPVCMNCGQSAEIIHGAYLTDDDWIRCDNCGLTQRISK